MDINQKIFNTLYPFDSTSISVENSTGSIKINYEDCVENSILQIIYLLNIDINDPSQIDICLLKSRTTNIKLIAFFEKYPKFDMYEKDIQCRSKWASILSFHKYCTYTISDSGCREGMVCKNNTYHCNDKHYEMNPLLENFFNVIWSYFDEKQQIRWSELKIPINGYLDSYKYQKYLDTISKYFSRYNFKIKFDIIDIMDTRHLDYIETGINVNIIISINDKAIWLWHIYSYFNHGTMFDAHSVINKCITLIN